MTSRTIKNTVTFTKPFVLGKLDEVLPAGTYALETHEELLQTVSFPAYRRVLTLIHLHPERDQPGVERTLVIDPKELDAALKRDQTIAKTPPDMDSGQRMLQETTVLHREETARQSIARAENEGMILHPR